MSSIASIGSHSSHTHDADSDAVSVAEETPSRVSNINQSQTPLGRPAPKDYDNQKYKDIKSLFYDGNAFFLHSIAANENPSFKQYSLDQEYVELVFDSYIQFHAMIKGVGLPSDLTKADTEKFKELLTDIETDFRLILNAPRFTQLLKEIPNFEPPASGAVKGEKSNSSANVGSSLTKQANEGQSVSVLIGKINNAILNKNYLQTVQVLDPNTETKLNAYLTAIGADQVLPEKKQGLKQAEGSTPPSELKRHKKLTVLELFQEVSTNLGGIGNPPAAKSNALFEIWLKTKIDKTSEDKPEGSTDDASINPEGDGTTKKALGDLPSVISVNRFDPREEDDSDAITESSDDNNSEEVVDYDNSTVTSEDGDDHSEKSSKSSTHSPEEEVQVPAPAPLPPAGHPAAQQLPVLQQAVMLVQPPPNPTDQERDNGSNPPSLVASPNTALLADFVIWADRRKAPSMDVADAKYTFNNGSTLIHKKGIHLNPTSEGMKRLVDGQVGVMAKFLSRDQDHRFVETQLAFKLDHVTKNCLKLNNKIVDADLKLLSLAIKLNSLPPLTSAGNKNKNNVEPIFKPISFQDIDFASCVRNLRFAGFRFSKERAEDHLIVRKTRPSFDAISKTPKDNKIKEESQSLSQLSMFSAHWQLDEMPADQFYSNLGRLTNHAISHRAVLLLNGLSPSVRDNPGNLIFIEKLSQNLLNIEYGQFGAAASSDLIAVVKDFELRIFSGDTQAQIKFRNAVRLGIQTNLVEVNDPVRLQRLLTELPAANYPSGQVLVDTFQLREGEQLGEGEQLISQAKQKLDELMNAKSFIRFSSRGIKVGVNSKKSAYYYQIVDTAFRLDFWTKKAKQMINQQAGDALQTVAPSGDFSKELNFALPRAQLAIGLDALDKPQTPNAPLPLIAQWRQELGSEKSTGPDSFMRTRLKSSDYDQPAHNKPENYIINLFLRLKQQQSDEMLEYLPQLSYNVEDNLNTFRQGEISHQPFDSDRIYSTGDLSGVDARLNHKKTALELMNVGVLAGHQEGLKTGWHGQEQRSNDASATVLHVLDSILAVEMNQSQIKELNSFFKLEGLAPPREVQALAMLVNRKLNLNLNAAEIETFSSYSENLKETLEAKYQELQSSFQNNQNADEKKDFLNQMQELLVMQALVLEPMYKKEMRTKLTTIHFASPQAGESVNTLRAKNLLEVDTYLAEYAQVLEHIQQTSQTIKEPVVQQPPNLIRNGDDQSVNNNNGPMPQRPQFNFIQLEGDGVLPGFPADNANNNVQENPANNPANVLQNEPEPNPNRNILDEKQDYLISVLLQGLALSNLSIRYYLNQTKVLNYYLTQAEEQQQ